MNQTGGKEGETVDFTVNHSITALLVLVVSSSTFLFERDINYMSLTWIFRPRLFTAF